MTQFYIFSTAKLKQVVIPAITILTIQYDPVPSNSFTPMKGLITGVFQLIYSTTGAKTVAYVCALIYITVLHLTVIFGLGLLLEGWLSVASVVHLLFKFPIILGTAAAVFAINLLIAPAWQNVTKEGKKVKRFSPIILYTAVSLIVLLYTQYYDKIF